MLTGVTIAVNAIIISFDVITLFTTPIIFLAAEFMSLLKNITIAHDNNIYIYQYTTGSSTFITKYDIWMSPPV